MRRAADVAQLNATAPDQLTAPGALEGRLAGSALYVQVIDRPGGSSPARAGSAGGIVDADERAARPPALASPTARSAPSGCGSTPRRWASSGAARPRAARCSSPASWPRSSRTLDHTRRLVALCALAAALLAAVAGDAPDAPRAAPADPPVLRRAGDRALRRPRPSACRTTTTGDEVGELAETLNAMLASLERAQEAEHRFVGDASHELRTPLTALRGNAAYIARHGADPEVLAEIEAGADAAQRAARRPAGAGPRGRGGARQGRAGRALGARAGRRRGDRRATTSPSGSSAPRSSARSRTSSATPASTARAR